MNSLRLLFAQLGVVAILAGLHIYGIIHFYYWRFHWFDLVSHLLAGLWAGLFAYWLALKLDKEPNILFCVGVAFSLGVIWELFEFLTGVTNLPAEILDTLKDLLMDTLGGLAGVLLARRIDGK
ncbi:MAG: hypothetical protein AAB830_01480 [Patescibacteria group bacterium]